MAVCQWRQARPAKRKRNPTTKQKRHLPSHPKTIPDMVNAMYTETPHILYMAAGQSVLSHLFQLTETGQVATEGDLTADSVFTLGAGA